MRKNTFSRMMAIGLSAVLTFSSVDLRVFAEIGEDGPRKTITNIQEIDEEIARQTLYIGASEEDIIFPDTLDVTVTYQEEIETKKKIEKDEEVEPDREASTEATTEEIDEDLPEDIDPDADPEQNPEVTPEPVTPEPGIPEHETPEPAVDSEPAPEETPEPADNASEESGEGLIGMIFPAIKAYAASDEADLDKSEEPEEPKTEPEANPENKKGEPEEEQYEIVKEIVTVTEDITIENVKWELDKENSSFDKFSSDEAGAEFVYVPAISGLYEVEALLPTITVKILKEEVPLEYMVLEAEGVRVEGNLPVGSTLQVTPIDISEAESLLDDPSRVVLYALDVCIMLDGEEIEPDESVKVTLTPPADIETEVLENDTFELVHFPDESEKEVVETQVNDRGELEFEMDSFSPIALTALKGTGVTDNVEPAAGLTFNQAVTVKFADASLITEGTSKIKLTLYGNIANMNVKDGENASTEAFIIGEAKEITITEVDDPGTGKTTATISTSFDSIPVCIQEGTGDKTAGGEGTYKIPEGFYGIKIETVDGYTPENLPGSGYYALNPIKDDNDKIWSTYTITINNKIMELTSPTFNLEWQDNRNYADNRPYSTKDEINADDVPTILSKIYVYYQDGGSYVKVDGAHPTSVSRTSFSTWNVAFKNLPKKNEAGVAYSYYAKLVDGFYPVQYYQASGEYVALSEGTTAKLTLTYTDAITGTIVWRAENAVELPEMINSGLFTDAGMKLYKAVGSDDPAEVTEGYTVSWTKGQKTDGLDTHVTWKYSISGLPLYAANGDAIVYYTKMAETYTYSGATNPPTFKFTYDNGTASTDTDKCLSGEFIYATVIGDAEFSFDKVWYDGNDTESVNRRKLAITKGITLYLWRYPVNKEMKDGAPVTHNAVQYTYKLEADDDAGDVSVNSINIGLSDFAVSGEKFPSYDEMGYKYVYYVTEVSNSELYKTVYWNQTGDFTGSSSDKAVKNGGKLCNVRNGKIAPTVTKNWKVSAISDYVSSTCVFELQKKDGDNWVYVAEHELSGFSSSKKKVTGTFQSQELYDELGRRYEYRVIEKSVQSGSGVDAVFNTEGWQEEGTNKFSALYELNNYTYKATTEYQATVDENGVESAEATVVNKLYGTKNVYIRKQWSGDWDIGAADKDSKTGNVTIALKRDGATYATIVLEKPANKTDEKGSAGTFTLDCSDPLVVAENKTYTTSADGAYWETKAIVVPAYDEEGRQYNYTIEETGVATEQTYGKEYDRSITGKEIRLYVRNYTGSQTSSIRIDVSKTWKDDSDYSQRGDVLIKIGTYDGSTFVPSEYSMTLTAGNDYQSHVWVDPTKFMTTSELATYNGKTDENERKALRAAAIKNHLNIQATLKNGTVEREIKNRVTEGNTTTGVIEAIVDESSNYFRPGYKVNIVRNDAGTGYTITNTRVAGRSFTFTKVWQDSANALKSRGDFLRVALFREVSGVETEVAYRDIRTYVGNELNPDLEVKFEQYYPAYDENGNNYTYSVKEYICKGTPATGEMQCENGQELDLDTLTSKILVDVNATKDTTKSGYVVTVDPVTTVYKSVEGSADLGYSDVNSVRIEDSYKYTNQASGARSEVDFYVIWHDKAKSDQRPDMYLTLYYRVNKNDPPVLYNSSVMGEYTERWESVIEGDKYIQKAIFSGLPIADENGNVYTYYVAETLNNATSDYDTDHYTDPLFDGNGEYNTGAVKVETIDGEIQLQALSSLEKDSVIANDGSTPLTQEESFTVTGITDTIQIEGRKLWQGVPEGIDKDKLPNAYIYLFRSSKHDTTNQVPSDEEVKDKTKEQKMEIYQAKAVSGTTEDGSASPRELNPSKAMYAFGKYSNDGVASYAQFPKYDDLGYQYKYSVREVIYNTFNHELPAEVMHPVYSLTDNNTDLANQYVPDSHNKRNFIITKVWNISSNYTIKPAKATFRLYRKETNSDGRGYTNDQYVESDLSTTEKGAAAWAALNFDIDNDELVAFENVYLTNDQTTNNTIRWENFPIFAPSGKLYCYYAVEMIDDMPGYESSVAVTGNNIPMSKDGTYIGVAFENRGIGLTELDDPNERTATFTNVYKTSENIQTIKFSKQWNVGNAPTETKASLVPSVDIENGIAQGTKALNIKLYAKAVTQSGKDNNDTLEFTEGTDYTISVAVDESGSNADSVKWDYTITFNTNKYAPVYSANGNLYKYYVEETLNSGFVQANYTRSRSVISQTATAGAHIITFGTPLSNSLKGSFTVQKRWDDFNNDYGMREGSVQFDVYYRVGESGSWTICRENVELKSSNGWKTTFSGLPITANIPIPDENAGNAGAVYQYKVVETKIVTGNQTITVSAPGSDMTAKWTPHGETTPDTDVFFKPVEAGNYKVYNPAIIETIAGGATKKIVNQLDTDNATTSLTVTKNWVDDSNKYGIRPTNLTLRIDKSIDGTDWSEVTRRTISNFEVSGDTWTYTFENLPKYFFNGTENVEYQYRVVEIAIGGRTTELNSSFAGNGGSYSIAHEFGSSNGVYTTNITNTLIKKTGSIHVKKIWNSSAAERKNVDVTLYSANFEGGANGVVTNESSLKPVTFTGSVNTLGHEGECEYAGLPMYNKDGNTIVYYVKETSTGDYKTQYASGSATYPASGVAVVDALQHTTGTTDDSLYVKVVNTPFTKITGSKIWSDENNKYSLRPARVELTLQRRIGAGEWAEVSADELHKTNASASPVVTVNEAGSWKATTDKLPLYALSDGSSPVKYQYRLAELSIPNAYTRNIEKAASDLTPEDGYEYGGSDTAQTSAVTNYLITRGDITVNKVWNTNSETDKHDVSVKLYSKNLVNGTGTGANADVPGATATLSGSNLSKTFTGLPAVNKDGNEIVYYVEEDADPRYDTAYYIQDGAGFAKVEKANAKSSGTGTFEFKIVNTPLTQITGRKVWEDDDNGFGLRPESLPLTLQRRIGSGEWANVTAEELHTTNSTASPTVDVNATGSWEATIDKLPLYELSDGANPAKYQYRLAEPASIPAYTRDRAKEITELLPDDGYVYAGSDTSQTSEVTNYLVLRDQAIKVEKIWNTDTDSQKKDVVVKLLSRNFETGTDDGTSDLTVVEKNRTPYSRDLNAGVNWKAVIEDLPLKNKSGDFIVYYISETTVDGAATEYYLYNGTDFEKVQEQQVKSDAEKALLTKIINTPYTTASVEKVWSDDSNKFVTRPNSTYVKLQRKTTAEENWTDVAGQAVIELNETNSWSASVENLPLYVEYALGADPVRYEYRFLETNAGGSPFVPLGYSLISADAEYAQTNDGTEAGYVTTYESDAYKTVITNTLITKSITAVKIWDDNSDAQKIRPAEITLFVDEAAGYIKYNNARITNKNLNVTPTKSSDGNTWTYVFTGLPKYAYGTGASVANPTEIVYTITEDVETRYENGFIIQNYYQTTYGVDEIATTITNTAMESDGVLLVEKKIEKRTDSETVTTYAFPFKVSFTRPDNTVAPYTGKYYLYDASIGDEDLRTDAKATEPAYDRIELSSSDGTIRIPSGKVAALVGINTMYQYTVTENPNHAGYEVKEITVTDTNATKATAADSSAGGTYGYATGKVPTASADAVRVKFTNQLLDYEHNKYLKVENTTDVVTNNRGEVLTGGEVKVFKSSVVIDNTVMAHDSSNGYDYVNDQTPYIQEAMSVEFKPDTTHGYSYSDTLTISWWDSNEASSEGAAHHVSISGFVYRDAAGIQHPYTGKLTKNADNSITSESEFAEFESVWSPLLGESTPFKHLTVLEGSVVVTLASAASEMPAKTLVQVEFNAPPKPAPATSGGDSDNSSNSDSNSSSKAATAVAVVDNDNKVQDQITRDGSIQGVRTGDDTPLTALIMLFIAFALCFSAVFGKYMRIKPGKK
ncbi:Cna B-type domain-containing protein [Butyrivibrio sp. VCB2001]|uniref:Cna B-type domain-containing protein n=1 Tax=Butyrivibrio sp. VCB2001 TaxID=1280667 RepID=UPI0004180522|nr:Cna B-type domain-containing protein [Butyrivibrio sp. VCB2001]